MRLGEWCATAGRRLLDSVLPPLCLGCNEIVAEPGALCATCWPAFSFLRARSALVYDDRSRRLVLPFKHGDRTDMAKSCGLWMARAGRELLAEADLVAPVPLHWRRLFMRRYNQALLLAHSAARPSGRPV